MSVQHADVLLEEAAAYIAVAESGDAEQSAYEQAAIKMEAAMRENPALTQRDVAARVGKSRNYVNKLLQALSRARVTSKPFRVDWGSGTNQRKKVLEQAEPEALIGALHKKIEEAPPAKREKLAKKVTDESTVAGRHIANQVVERKKKEKKKPEQAPPITGIPLPSLWASMCMTIDEWVRELSTLRDEDLLALAQGNPDGAERVLAVVDRLDEQVQRYRNGLRTRPDLRVIELDGVIDMVV